MNINSILQFKKKIETKLALIPTPPPQSLLQEINEMENDFHTFLKGAWHVIEGPRPFIDGWHIKAVCEHLEALYNLQIKTLLCNVPPGTCKSTIFSIAFPAWVWCKDPSLQFMYSSFGAALSRRDNVNCRRLIQSPWFQKRWGNKCQLTGDVNTKMRFENCQGGYRIATSIKGAATGEHVDFIFFDDPNNAADTESDIKRDGTNEICDRVMYSRFNNPETGRLGIVQQRLHMQDFSGHILAKDIKGLVHLCLPMEYEPLRSCVTIPLKSTPKKPWRDPRKKEGELLWPQFFDQEDVEKLKVSLRNQYAIAGQLQQNPSPTDGVILKRASFKWWKEQTPPKCHFVLQSWDTALSAEENAASSCCTTWGVFNDSKGVSNIILLDVYHERVEYPELRKMAIRLAHNYHDTNRLSPIGIGYECKPDMILIEAKVSGISLIQDLRKSGLIINRFDPVKHGGGDKVVRARLMSYILEAGKIWMPAQPPHYDKLRKFADILVEACVKFPKDANTYDYVDSMSQAVIKLRMMGLIGITDDYVPNRQNIGKKEKLY